MIDIHCHILFDIDDGARDFDETMEMCSIAEKDGITAIIGTPHYIEGAWQDADVKNKILMINKELKNRSINLQIMPGNEIYLALNSYQCLLEGKCNSLNNSRYVLVEFTMMDIPNFVHDALYNLIIKGFIPIIAHPERNLRIMEEPQLVYDFIMEGCLIQINSTSLAGISGKGAQRLSELLIKHRMVHFIASDAHSSKHRAPILSKAFEYTHHISGYATGEKLFNTNPKAIIKDEEIKIDKPIKLKNRKKFSNILRT